jgi:hypothetical protein
VKFNAQRIAPWLQGRPFARTPDKSLAMRRVLVILALLSAVAVAAAAYFARRSDVGYFSPVYSPDGSSVYFIQRETSGYILGFGFEFFTPPARVVISSDRFSLRKLDLGSDSVDTVESFESSPLGGRQIRTYRGRSFGSASTQLRWLDGERLEYKITVSWPEIPTSRRYSVSRRWNNVTNELVENKDWSAEWADMGGTDVSPINGEWELLAPRGSNAFPCAIAAFNSASGEIKVLIKSPEFEAVYPRGLTVEHLVQLSKREDIEHIERLKFVHDELLTKALAEGMQENEAQLKVIRQMEELGFYPRSAYYTATKLGAGESAALRETDRGDLFSISETEFTASLYPDIEKAIESPGEEVERSMGQYIRYDGYDTSERLNKFLDGGGAIFHVERQGRIYRIELHRP